MKRKPCTSSHAPFSTLNVLHHRWTNLLIRVEDLTCRHLRTVTHNYQHASLCAHAMKHLRDLRSLYDSAKRAYHICGTRYTSPVHTNSSHNMSLKRQRLIVQQSKVPSQSTQRAQLLWACINGTIDTYRGYKS